MLENSIKCAAVIVQPAATFNAYWHEFSDQPTHLKGKRLDLIISILNLDSNITDLTLSDTPQFIHGLQPGHLFVCFSFCTHVYSQCEVSRHFFNFAKLIVKLTMTISQTR